MPRTQILPNRCLHVSHQRGRQSFPRLHQEKQHDRLIIIARSSLANADSIGHAMRKTAFQHGVEFRAAEADARGIQHAISAAEEDDPAGDGVYNDEITLCPDVVVRCKVCVKVECLFRIVIPEAHWHVGKCGCGDEFARSAVGDGRAAYAEPAFDRAVVDCDGGAERGALGPADVDWGEGVFLAEAAGLEGVWFSLDGMNRLGHGGLFTISVPPEMFARCVSLGKPTS